jgi:hypothetical protein
MNKKGSVSSNVAGKTCTRQTFIKSTLAPALMLGATRAANAEAEAPTETGTSPSEPLFRFLQVNDLHIQHEGKGYKDANLRASWLFDAIEGETHFPKPDFILGIGDLIHGESIEGITAEFQYLRENFLDGLSVPFHHIMGNHECKQNEGNAEFEAPFVQAYGADHLNYRFEHKGIEFIAFNDAGTYCIPEARELARKETLQKLLRKNPALPKIVCCHIPLIPIREESVLAESFGFISYKIKDSATLDVLQAPEHNVLAVLSGHLHLTGRTVKAGIHHISISGLASYPHDIAMYSVFRDRIDVDVIRIPSDLLTPATNIHGARRHKKDFTDATHPNYSQYIMGNENERSFSMKMGSPTP